ncbi:TPA: antiviral reverse transcriptase Drt3b [Photobacterium damselae]
MRNKVVDKDNYIRAVVTDTLPFDTPMIFSNDGYYLNLIETKSEIFKKIVKNLITNNTDSTKPFQYTIRKDADSTRKLSLIHPSSQYRMAKFYHEYAELICYYTNKSNFSLRYPKKISSTFFNNGVSQDANKLKSDNVEAVVNDLKNKHSISFFAYGGYSRIYKFLSSNEFIRLERKYDKLDILDVSKCFENIYSHSLPWATKNKEHVKENVKNKATFGQSFDKLMQESNYNETNGIVVGPEISRIFAEIIFQKIDLQCKKNLSEINNIIYGVDYEIKRYIDDTFIFSKNKEIARIVFNRYTDELSKYNLHLNNKKTVSYCRPFLTKQSKVVIKMNDEINELREILYSKNEEKGIEFNRVFNYIKLSNKFISKMKLICIDNDCGYDDVTSYLISALENISTNVITLAKNKHLNEIDSSSLKNIFRTIINISFHFYSISPSVSSSYVLSRMCLTIARFFEKYNRDYEDTIKQYIFDNTISFFETSGEYNNVDRDGLLPLEVINLILFTSELGCEYKLSEDKVINLFAMEGKFETYFQLVSSLYYMKGYHTYNKARKNTIKAIDNVIMNCNEFTKSSGPTHIILDSLSCPYIDEKSKTKWIKHLLKQLSIKDVASNEITLLVSEFESCYWFVNWREFNLINMLEKKLLKSNY